MAQVEVELPQSFTRPDLWTIHRATMIGATIRLLGKENDDAIPISRYGPVS